MVRLLVWGKIPRISGKWRKYFRTTKHCVGRVRPAAITSAVFYTGKQELERLARRDGRNSFALMPRRRYLVVYLASETQTLVRVAQSVDGAIPTSLNAFHVVVRSNRCCGSGSAASWSDISEGAASKW